MVKGVRPLSRQTYFTVYLITESKLTFLEATANELAKHPFVTNDVALVLKRFMLRFVLHSHGKTWCLPRALYAEKENY